MEFRSLRNPISNSGKLIQANTKSLEDPKEVTNKVFFDVEIDGKPAGSRSGCDSRRFGHFEKHGTRYERGLMFCVLLEAAVALAGGIEEVIRRKMFELSRKLRNLMVTEANDDGLVAEIAVEKAVVNGDVLVIENCESEDFYDRKKSMSFSASADSEDFGCERSARVILPWEESFMMFGKPALQLSTSRERNAFSQLLSNFVPNAATTIDVQ
uniref:Uncharacterized protein n=1 Tax=Chenopodium quinoa TaxID=63459 RepID=A0A803N229_CHEQI